MIEKLKAEVARMGADAIIVRSANEGTWGDQGLGTIPTSHEAMHRLSQ